MKIQCDVCKGEEASVFCCADEAALCDGCDRRVHCANKLAGKHRRFSLLPPTSPHHYPLCDVCQEKRAFLFCQEDRAILCRDCDFPIHNSNDLTKKHNRFLFTGIKLSSSATTAAAATATATATDATPVPSSTSSLAASGFAAISSSTSEEGDELLEDVNDKNHHHHRIDNTKKQRQRKPRAASAAAEEVTETKIGINTSSSGNTSGGGGGSSISEYLIKELPGWHVEDLLLDSSLAANPTITTTTFGFSKTGEDLTPFLEADLDGSGGFAAEDFNNNNKNNHLSMWWVPQVPQAPPPNPVPPRPPPPPAVHHDYHHGIKMGMGMDGDLTKAATRQEVHHHHHDHHQQQQQQRWVSDDGFTVPEIQASDQRSRPSWFIT